MGQRIMDQEGEDFLEKETNDISKDSERIQSPFLSGSEKDMDFKIEEDNRTPNQKLPRQLGTNDNYLEHDNKEIISSIRKRGTSALQLSYLRDNYTYRDNSSTFAKTYDSSEGDRYGFLLVGGDRYFNKGSFHVGWGFQTGFGLSQGKGIFNAPGDPNDGQYSDANFTLWTIPVDLLANLQIPLGRVIHLQVNGGPSGVILIQTRSDREQKDRDKSRRQFGYGYTLGGKIKFNLSQISKSIGFNMYKNYNISNFYINLEGRTHSYSGFKEDGIEISGTSVGIGFTFEYL